MAEKIKDKESERLKKQKRRGIFRILGFILVGLAILGLLSIGFYTQIWDNYLGVREVSYSKFSQDFELFFDSLFGMGIGNTEKLEQVEKVDVRDDVLVIFWKDKAVEPIRVRVPFKNFVFPELSQDFVRAGVKVNSTWGIGLELFIQILVIFGIVLGLAFMFFWLPRIALGKSLFDMFKKKTKAAESSKYTFDDVAGVDEARHDLQQTVEFLKKPEGFEVLGAMVPKGILLLGPPGCGKTLLARAVAGEAKVPFFSSSGSEFVEIIVGVGAQRIRELFEEAKKSAPCIIFIDEIDSVGRVRGGAGPSSGADSERDQTLNQLLAEMDGFNAKLGVVVIGATNRPDLLDPGLVRPGRFDRKIVIPLPDSNGREEILRVHVRKKPLAEDVDLKKIAKGTVGFSGADLADLANKAALRAGRLNNKREEEKRSKIWMEDFNFAKQQVLMGSERRNFFLSEEEQKHNAYYEAAKVVVAKNLPLADPIYMVSIVPRGLSMGKTQLLPEKDRYLTSKDHILTQIKILLAGRAFEEIFGQESNRALEDLQRANQLAVRIICEFGMDEVIGPRSLGRKEDLGYMGSEITRYCRDFCEEKAEIMDRRIQGLLYECLEYDKDILLAKKKHLDKISETLVVKEELEAEEIDSIFKN